MKVSLGSVSALCVVLTAATAQGAIVTVDFEARVESITTLGLPGNAPLQARYSVGDLVSGQLTYTTEAMSSSSLGVNRKLYFDSLLSMSISIDGDAYSATGGRVFVDDNDFNRDNVLFEGSVGVSGPNIGGAFRRMQFMVGSTNRTILTSLDVPDAMEVNSLADIYQGNTNFVTFDGGGTVRYDITSFQAQTVPQATVPEPSTMVAWSVLGVVGLAFGYRRRNKMAA